MTLVIFSSNLTHWGRVRHICISNLPHHWFRWWLITFSEPSHYLNQYWFVIDWTSRNNFQWNLNQNTTVFILEIWLKNVVCEWRPFCLSLNVLKENQKCRDHSRYGLSQWDTTLQCNVISHWLSPYPECFLELSLLLHYTLESSCG